MISNEDKMESINPVIGLTEEQIERRKEKGLVNGDVSVKTKSVKEILSGNLFTLFNLLNVLLGVAVILVGAHKNLLFLGVVICNIIISTAQQIQSKRIIDKLSVIAATKMKVMRNGAFQKIEMEDIVIDDVIEWNLGNQIVVDSIIISGACEVNESFITGESEAVYKKKGDMILSGSFISSGKCLCQVIHIGADNYTAKISSEAKYLKKINSEIMFALNKVIKFVSIIIIPMGILLFLHQMSIDANLLQDAVVKTVAALIGMIPEGLILLTSMVLAVSVIRLSKYHVLVQELYCIETLARVDVICLDKTGTITEGSMEVEDIIPYDGMSKSELRHMLSTVALSLEGDNATILAIQNKYKEPFTWTPSHVIPFSSAKKWSGVSFETIGTFIIGAPEIVMGEAYCKIKEIVEAYSDDYRVLLIARSKTTMKEKELPTGLEPLGFILIKDKIRTTAKETLDYFKAQGVEVKIISGDNVKTVASIARSLEIDGADNYIDASTLDTTGDIEDAVGRYTIFGRVSPTQKKELILALKRQGHIVAMTGDGMNDVLALKEADCSIVMASGSDAARNVAQLVLLESNFDAMPKVVAEGRRSINNIERSATLFLVKTIYTTVLAFLFLFISVPYPFIPIQLTLTSMVTIGIPSFILALEPNKERMKENFLLNVIGAAIPSAAAIVINILLVTLVVAITKMTTTEASTLSMVVTAYIGFLLLYRLCVPFDWIRKILYGSMIAIFAIGILCFPNFFSIAIFTPMMFVIIILLLIGDVYLFRLLTSASAKILSKYKRYFIKKK